MRTLTDQLHQHRIGGKVVINSRVQPLGLSILMLIEDAVARFGAFGSENDPFGVHDFGVVRVQGHTVFFNIEANDEDLRYHSTSPANPTMTRRVLALMLADHGLNPHCTFPRTASEGGSRRASCSARTTGA